MLRLDAPRPVTFCDGLSRRDFLHVGALSVLGLTLPRAFAAQDRTKQGSDVNGIMLFLVGGPSHIDTWDPKPDAPKEVRGPFSPIDTKANGMRITEIFPRMAQLADKFSLIRSVYHTATAVHDTGHQMMQTGRLFSGGVEHPHVGCVLGYLKGRNGEVPPHVLIPRPIGRTGGNMPHGQTAGYLGKPHDPFVLNADPNAKDFKVPDLLPPDYVSSVRAKRRQKMRAAVEGALETFEKTPQRRRRSSSTTTSSWRIGSCRASRPARRSTSTANRTGCATATAAPASASRVSWRGASSSAACASSPSTCSRPSSTRSPGTFTGRSRSPTLRKCRAWSRRISTGRTAP
jgi:hypothetical protein